MRILCVDDDDRVRMSICSCLSAEGHDLAQARDGTGAFALLDDPDRAIDMLVTDIEMPGGPDGWDVACHARAARPELPILYITGGEILPRNALPRSRLLRKPFTPNALLAEIAALRIRASARAKCA